MKYSLRTPAFMSLRLFFLFFFVRGVAFYTPSQGDNLPSYATAKNKRTSERRQEKQRENKEQKKKIRALKG